MIPNRFLCPSNKIYTTPNIERPNQLRDWSIFFFFFDFRFAIRYRCFSCFAVGVAVAEKLGFFETLSSEITTKNAIQIHSHTQTHTNTSGLILFNKPSNIYIALLLFHWLETLWEWRTTNDLFEIESNSAFNSNTHTHILVVWSMFVHRHKNVASVS